MMDYFKDVLINIKNAADEIKSINSKPELLKKVPDIISTVIDYEKAAIYSMDFILDEVELYYSNLSEEQTDSFTKKLNEQFEVFKQESINKPVSIDGMPAAAIRIQSQDTGYIIYLFRPSSYEDWEYYALELIKGSIETVLHLIAAAEKEEVFKQQVIRMISRAIEKRSNYTGGHSERVAQYAAGIARAMGKSESQIDIIKRAGLLHDIGKVGVPDRALNKAEKLTDEEYELMKSHSREGARILESLGFFHDLIPYVLYHHEKYDGTGYPFGLEGDAIPEGAQIISVADALDALTSDRVYRKATPWSVAVEEIIRAKGSQFSPVVVDAFLVWLNQPEMIIGPLNNPGNDISRTSKNIPLLCNKCGITLPYPVNGVSNCYVCGESFNVEQIGGVWHFK
ncbi:cyclic di-GMP phosphodiesterase response regulator RpfG [Oxobacter pfennigii]|uniref:Cyclic di-GMP phosphodiesterase response regulator RpfG n=1 Tax=Oxobacter pfennigii TaxID=36849 RepID=A0A0P9AJE4_9CLOT|nr:HD-GYP domain-containing protein [Oxobacter pfennigii]KPU45537.1 cyclic di-GMP phosphodiesterase response regulator RpfG [Oxobacter pfennigii]